MARIFFIDPSLRGYLGHHFYEIHRFIRLIKSEAQYHVFANKACECHFPNKNTKTIPYFEVSTYTHDVMSHKVTNSCCTSFLVKLLWLIERHTPLRRLANDSYLYSNLKSWFRRKFIFESKKLNFRGDNESLKSIYTEEINAIIKDHKIDCGDHVIVPTAEIELTAAIIEIIKHYPSDELPTFHLRYINLDCTALSSAYTYKELFAQIQRLKCLERKMYIYTETRPHANFIEGIVNHPVSIVPHPVEKHRDSTKSFLRQDRKCRIGCVGAARKEKGINILPELIECFYTKYPDTAQNIEFIVQATEGEKEVMDRLRIVHAKFSSVKLITSVMQPDEYKELFCSLDIALLPYDPDIYKDRGSGILSDAIINEIPFICSRGSYLEGAITNNNALAAQNVQEYAACITRMFDNYSVYQDNAKRASERLEAMIKNNALTNFCF